MKEGKCNVATCQFAVGADIVRNSVEIRRKIKQAAGKGAHVAHFPETALSGYAGANFTTWKGFKWDVLKQETLKICDLAREKKIWVVLGSTHPIRKNLRPHNSLYVINPKGNIVDRYDKRFLTQSDLKYYSPGDHFSIFTINGVRCGLLICYDVRFPELYREYKKRGVQLMFHSFHNAKAKGETIHTTIMRPSLQARAATNYMWVSANNSPRYYQLWSSICIQPDGRIVSSLRRHVAGLDVNTIDTLTSFYDASGPFRNRAMKGILNSGTLIRDPRSRDRKCL